MYLHIGLTFLSEEITLHREVLNSVCTTQIQFPVIVANLQADNLLSKLRKAEDNSFVICNIAIFKLSKLPGHGRVIFCQPLDSYILRFVVRKAKISVSTQQSLLRLL